MNIHWLIPAVGSALAEAYKDVFVKKATGGIDRITIAWAWWAFAAILATAALIPLMWLRGFPEIGPDYWTIILVRTVFEVCATLLFVESLRRADLSIATPMLAFTPALVVPIEAYWTGDLPSTAALIGIGIVVVSTGLLQLLGASKNAAKRAEDLLGALMMLGVSVLYAITTFAHRLAIEQSGPFFYAWSGTVVLAIALTLLVVIMGRTRTIVRIRSTGTWAQLAAVGGMQGLVFLLQVIAQSLTLASLAIAGKRTSIIFSALLGRTVFAEREKFWTRLTLIVFAATGTILLVF